MKRAFLALAFLLLLAISTWAQTPACSDSETVVDTTHVELSFSTTTSRTIAWEVVIERASSGRIDAVINPTSIKFSGDCSGLNTMPTSQIFDVIAMATVSQEVGSGYMTCSASCASPTITKIYLPACVHRAGTDADTHFESCSPNSCCTRTYSVCCPNGTGSPVITLISSQSTGCTPNSYCESTCP
jgi:hypothetical protein